MKREFRGRLGGTARLIHLINPNSTVLADWKQQLIECVVTILNLASTANNIDTDAKLN